MPKEVNLTGEEVVALTKEYLTEEDVHFVHKALVYAVECHSGQYRNQVSLISFTPSKWQVF